MPDTFRFIKAGIFTAQVYLRVNGDWAISFGIGNEATRLEATDIDAAEVEGKEVLRRRLTEAVKELDQ